MQDIIRKKNIVILGAGFGGLKCALEIEKRFKKLQIAKLPPRLRKQHIIYHKIIGKFKKSSSKEQHPQNDFCDRIFEKYNIMLIDKKDYQIYTPALYEVASTFSHDAEAMKLKEIATIPIAEAINEKKIKFIQAKIEKINLENKSIKFKDYNDLDFEYLVIAFGGKINYFNISGLAENAMPFKNFTDALKIRQTLFDLTNQKENIEIVIGGAGPSGVEISAELTGYINRLKNNFSGKNYQITLVEASDRILAGFNKKISEVAKNRLNKLGVKIICEKTISSVEKNKIFLKNDNNQIYFDILIWTGGMKPNPIADDLSLIKENNKKINVNNFLNCSPNIQNPSLKEKIFAIGDIACIYAPKTKIPIPINAKITMNQAKIAAENIINDITRKPKKEYPAPKYSLYLISVGKKYAIFKIYSFIIPGLPAWIIKILIQLNYLLSLLPFKKACRLWRQAIRIYARND